jgi:hypothetical protein
MKSTVKKPKHTFDELLAKYKKGNTHTRNRQNQSFRNVKHSSPRQGNVSVAG